MNPLASFVNEISLACDAGLSQMAHRVESALVDIVQKSSFLAEAHRKPQADSYARYLLYADPRHRFSVMALVWQPGQCSPIHGHYTWCSFAVLEGELEETHFDYCRSSRLARSVDVLKRNSGDAHFSHAGLDEIHQVRNASDETAVSVHVYGVDSRHVTTDVNRVVQSVG